MRQCSLTFGNRQNVSSIPSSPVMALPLTLAGFLSHVHSSTLEGTFFRSLRFPFCEALFTPAFCPVNASCLGFPRLPAPSLGVACFSLPALYPASYLPGIAGLHYLRVQCPESHCLLYFVSFFVSDGTINLVPTPPSLLSSMSVTSLTHFGGEHSPATFWWRVHGR